MTIHRLDRVGMLLACLALAVGCPNRGQSPGDDDSSADDDDVGPDDDDGPPDANSPPSIYSEPTGTGWEGVAWYYPVLAQDLDGDLLAFSLVEGPEGMWIEPATGLVAWTPEESGSVPVTVRVEDPAGASDEQSFDLTVDEGAQPPRITSTPPLSGLAGATWTYAATVEDPDDDVFDWAVAGPDGMEVDGSGLVSWPVPEGAWGNFAVELSVTDATGLGDVQGFSIGVAADGDVTPPTVSIYTPTEGASVAGPTDVVGTATDDAFAGSWLELCPQWPGGSCTLVKEGLAPVVDGLLGVLDPQQVANGTYDLVLGAVDAAGNEASTSVAVFVEGNNKLGRLRLSFEDMRVRTATSEVVLNRVYDGLETSLGELGHGWRYEWSMGHLEQPVPMFNGWEVVYNPMPPGWSIIPQHDHPVTFVLADGRVFRFVVLIEPQPGYSSVVAARPDWLELTTTGATLTMLDEDGAPYPDTWEMVVDQISGTVFDDHTTSDLFAPTWYQVDTDWNEVFWFEAATGRLAAWRDASGVQINVIDDEVTLDGQPLIEFETDAEGLVTAATDVLSGNRVEYTRDAANDLVQAIGIDGASQTFVYDDAHNLVSYAVPGQAPETWVYDDQGRVIEHVDAAGVVTLTTYDDAANTVITSDAAGNQVTTVYDDQGRVHQVTDPLGHTTAWTYVPGTDLEATRTDPLGNTWEFEYDDRDRRTVIRNPLDEEITYLFDDDTGRVTQATDGEGRSFSELLDDEGRPVAWVLADGTTARSFSYDGNTTTITDGLGQTSQVTLDDRGRVVARTRSDGGVVTTTFDDVLHQVSTVTAEGNPLSATLDPLSRFTEVDLGEGGTIGYDWGPTGRIEQVVRPDGVVQEFVHDAGGRLTEVLFDGQPTMQGQYNARGQTASVAGPGGARAWTWDGAGRLASETTADGTTSYSWDAAGNLVGASGDVGLDRSWVYDEANRPVALEEGDGSQVQVEYDASGRITQVTDGEGLSAQVSWDVNGRPAEVVYPGGASRAWTWYPSAEPGAEAPLATVTELDGTSWAFTWTGEELLETVTDGLGGVTAYAWDGDDHLEAVTDALGRSSTFSWAEAGLASFTTPEGRTQSWTHDAAGNAATWTRADGSVVAYSYGPLTIETLLPSGDVLTRTTDPVAGVVVDGGGAAGDVSTWTGALGQATWQQTDDGAHVELLWSGSGRLEGVVATLPDGTAWTTSYAWDDAGRMVELTDPDGGSTTFEWDDAGRITGVSRPDGSSSAFSYGDGNRPEGIEHVAASGGVQSHAFTYEALRLVGSSGPAGALEYEYDALGRLAVIRDLSTGQQEERTYDAVGNVIQVVDAAGTTTLSYDDDDRLLSSSGPAGTTTWTWSERGALVQRDGPEGTTAYAWDDLDRLVQVSLPDGAEVQYRYDAAGRLLSRIDAAGERRCLPLPHTPMGEDDCAATYAPGGSDPELRVHGPLGPASLHDGAGGATFLWSGLHNQVVGVTDGAGEPAVEPSYDPWGAPAAPGTVDYGWLGERQDPATGLVYLRSRWYDPSTGRFLSSDTFGAATEDPRTLHRYLYGIGDPLNGTDRTGRFTLSELTTVQGMQKVLRQIQLVISACLREELRQQVYQALAQWTANMIRGTAEEALASAFQAITGLPGGIGEKEKRFSEELAKILCGWRTEGDEPLRYAGGWEFEVLVDMECGTRRDVRRPTGTAALWDCVRIHDLDRFYTHAGIDILFDGRVPVELKLSKKTYKKNQLVAYCRFASRSGIHITMYGYWKFPDEDLHLEAAEDCIDCWDETPPGPCADYRGGVGSIYLAFGVRGNSEDSHAYVPDVSLCDRPR